MGQADRAIEAVERLINDIQMPRLGEIGIDLDKFEAVVDQMASDAIASGSPANNPASTNTRRRLSRCIRRCFAERK